MSLGLIFKSRTLPDPTHPGNYTGQVWGSLKSLGGWGDLSIQSIDVSNAYYYEFGLYGPTTSDLTADDAATMAADSNNESCVSRYAIVNLYNSGSSSISAAASELTAKPAALSTLSTQIQAPVDCPVLESSMRIAVGLLGSTLALAVSLF